MTTKNETPAIRIGLIGLSSSGKTHMVAMLSDIFWDVDGSAKTRLEFQDRETARLFEHAKRRMVVDGKFIHATPPHQNSLYRMIYENSGQLLGLGSFRHFLEILDVAGEQFLEGDETIYTDWLTKCNALIVLIDGYILKKAEMKEKKYRRKDKEIRQQIFLFDKLVNLIKLYLYPEHKRKHKIYLALCVSKYDFFEADPLPQPEDLVRERLHSVYKIMEDLRNEEKDWIRSAWYGFSSIGFVWDDTGSHYVDWDGNPVAEGNRVSQHYIENGEEVLYDPAIIRPEGIKAIFEDIRNFTTANAFIPPLLNREIVHKYRSFKPDNVSIDILENNIEDDYVSDYDSLDKLE